MKSKGRAMKSVRVGATLAAVSLLAVCAGSISHAATSSSQSVTISVASLIPGSTKAATQQFAQSGGGVREGKPLNQGQLRRVSMDGADVRGEARRGHAADRLRPCRSPTRARSATTDSSPTSPARRRHCRTSRSTTRRSSPKARLVRKIVALPTAAYAQALHYNRKLFAAAGLDPEQAADDLGSGRRPTPSDHRQDRHGRLRRDGQGRQHRRLDPDDARLLRWAAGWRPASGRRQSRL